MLWNKKDSLPLYPINSEKTLYTLYIYEQESPFNDS